MLDEATKGRIEKDIADQDVVLYMKGTPASHHGIPFRGVNVLEDEEIRQGIKEFSDWPTIPQLYVKGEFIGGCDIIREMHESGELAEMFKTRGVEASPA